MKWLAFALLLVGCNPTIHWVHVAKNPKEVKWATNLAGLESYDADRNLCLAAAQREGKTTWSRSQLFAACMGSYGWRLVEVIW